MMNIIFYALFTCVLCCSGSRANSVNDVIEALEKRLQDMEKRQNVCEKKIKHFEDLFMNHKVHKRSMLAQDVAFSTLLTSNQGHIGIGQTIKFDRVLLNDGAGYSVHSGVFTVPVAGVYMFTYFFGHGYAAGQVWLELMHNGNKVNAGVTDPFHEWQDLQGGNVAIIRAQYNDVIWIETFHQNDAFLFGDGFTSFSGVLLYT